MLIAWRIISQDYQYPDDALLRPRASMRGCHISDEAKIFFAGVPGGMRFARAFRIKPDRRAASRFAGGDPIDVMRRPRSTLWFNNVAQQCLGRDIKKSLYLNAEPLSARAPRIIAGRVRAAVPPDRRHESWPLLPPRPVTM